MSLDAVRSTSVCLTAEKPRPKRWPSTGIGTSPPCEFDGLQPLRPIAHGDAWRLRPGDWVYALGHPWGVQGAATGGVVIGIGSDLPELADGRRDWLVVSLHLRPGHSGGPVIDASGGLVGLNTLMTGPDIGAAIPIHLVEAFIHEAAVA